MTLLLDSALKATVILAAAWLATVALRGRSADIRHRIWLLAIFAVAALPALMITVPKTAPAAAFVGAAQLAASGTAGAQRVAREFPWLFVLWATGFAAVFARLVAGVARIAWITR